MAARRYPHFDCNYSCNLLKAKTLAFVEGRIIPVFYEKSSKNGQLIQVVLFYFQPIALVAGRVLQVVVLQR